MKPQNSARQVISLLIVNIRNFIRLNWKKLNNIQIIPASWCLDGEHGRAKSALHRQLRVDTSSKAVLLRKGAGGRRNCADEQIVKVSGVRTMNCKILGVGGSVDPRLSGL
jgi:hypothetical protein